MADPFKWAFMTGVVNELKAPNQFLRRLLFSRTQEVPTEHIQVTTLSNNREMAPFVRKNGEALMVGGGAEKEHLVEAPNIRIKKPFTPSNLLFGRPEGAITTNYRAVNSAAEQQRSINEYIQRELQDMEDRIVNAEEWLCAQALTGEINYEVADEEVFTITFWRHADAEMTMDVFLDDGDPTTVRLLATLRAVQNLSNQLTGLGMTDAICGSEAAAAIMELVEAGHLKWLDIRGISAGTVTFLEQFNDDGALYLGTFNQIRFWEYGRTILNNGVEEPLIRAKYIEFVARTPNAQRIMYYGAIPDMKALQGRRFQGRRFSKSWDEEDPSVRIALVHSRPLPIPRKPNAHISLKAVSG